MENKLYQALLTHYQAKIQAAEANLLIYFKNPNGVGEHSDVVGNMRKLVDEIATANGSLSVLNSMAAANQPTAEAPEAPVEGE